MGFNSGTYSFNGNTLTSVNCINLQLINALFIHSDVVNNKNDDILQEIYSNNVDYSNINYQATQISAYSKKLAIKQNSVHRFTLTDVDGNIIDLNGLDWNFTIIFYKHDSTFEMIRNYIKLKLIE